jgi:hypothetical protein
MQLPWVADRPLRKRDLHGIFRKIELDLEKMIKENPEPFNKYLDKFFYKS